MSNYRDQDRDYGSRDRDRDYGSRDRERGYGDRGRERDYGDRGGRDYGSTTTSGGTSGSSSSRDRDGYDRDRDRGRDFSRDRDRDRDRERDFSRDRDRDRERDGRTSSSSRDTDRSQGGQYSGSRYGDRGGPHDNNSRGPGGGRGGGRSFGGRGGGRGGRGGDMSRNANVTNLLRGRGMGDEDLIEHVLQPSEEDVSARVAAASPDGALAPPPFEEWRHKRDAVGARLTHASDVVIRSNHFRVDVSGMPTLVFQYHVHYCKYDREGVLEEELTTSNERDTNNRKQKDYRLYTMLMKQWRELHRDWFFDSAGRPALSMCFDGLNTVFTTTKLPFEGEFLREDVCMPTMSDTAPSPHRYQLTITTAVDGIVLPQSPEAWKDVDASVVRALDCSLFDFARWQQIETNPKWLTVGSKVFRADEDHKPVKSGIHALQGYYMSLKMCQAGLVLVSDLVVTAFLDSGELLNTMAALGGYRNMNDLLSDCQRGLPPRVEATLNSSLKGVKVKTHLGYILKIKKIGPPANSVQSEFEFDGVKMTVAQYFKERYHIDLKYPNAPTIFISKTALMPAELCSVPMGQVRSKQEPDMVAQLIRYAAVKPDERHRFIAEGVLLPELRKSDVTRGFGVSKIATVALSPEAVLLPPAKIQYGNSVVEPGLQGSWHSGKFFRSPPGAINGEYPYGILVVDPRRGQWEGPVQDVLQLLKRDIQTSGIRLSAVGSPVCVGGGVDELNRVMVEMLNRDKVRFFLIVLCSDVYGSVKLVGDRLGVITQCMRLDKFKNKVPGGYTSNLMLKINAKLGGINHTICSRYAESDLLQYRELVASGDIEPVFQDPPASLCWILDKHCMIVGIDVSHPEPGPRGISRDESPSIAAVVGTVNGSASQYVCHVAAQNSRMEVVDCLTEAMFSLLGSFRERNGGQMPKHLLVYRDGVGESQFEKLLEHELASIQEAIDMQKNHDGVKIAFVVCQKSHHARFVCESQGGTAGYTNLCPGIVIDGTAGDNGVTSTKYNEFYLNSHTAIQGTGKAAKYSLIYDDLNLKMIELEVLTYWLTYMYCRCNRSVSVCTPVYYAHWAATRARHLLNAGAISAELKNISNAWAKQEFSPMFFV